MLATETRQGCSNAFGDLLQKDQQHKDPVHFCANLCYEDRECKFFSAYAKTFHHPGRCCFFSGYKKDRVTASAGGFFALSRLQARDETTGWGQIMQHLVAKGCDMSSFSARLKAVDAACCGSDGQCPGGVPTSCAFICAEKYVPLYDRCHKLLVKMMGKGMPAFTKLHHTCLTQASDEISKVYAVARAKKNCVFEASFVDERGLVPTPDGSYSSNHGYNGHRRTQHFGFPAQSNSRCPFDKFTERATRVNKICGLDGGSSHHLPTSCGPSCAAQLNPFVADCRDLIARFLDDEMQAFDALHRKCHDLGVSTALYMIESMEVRVALDHIPWPV